MSAASKDAGAASVGRTRRFGTGSRAKRSWLSLVLTHERSLNEGIQPEENHSNGDDPEKEMVLHNLAPLSQPLHTCIARSRRHLLIVELVVHFSKIILAEYGTSSEFRIPNREPYFPYYISLQFSPCMYMCMSIYSCSLSKYLPLTSSLDSYHRSSKFSFSLPHSFPSLSCSLSFRLSELC